MFSSSAIKDNQRPSQFDSGGFHSQYDAASCVARLRKMDALPIDESMSAFDSGGFVSEYDTVRKKPMGDEIPAPQGGTDTAEGLPRRFDSGGFVGEYDFRTTNLVKNHEPGVIDRPASDEPMHSADVPAYFDSGGFRSEYDTATMPLLKGIGVLDEPIGVASIPRKPGITTARPAHMVRKASAHPPLRLSRSSVWAAAVVASIVVVFAGIYAFRFNGTLWDYYRTWTNTNFESTPYFSMARFDAIKRGMTRADVRDALGYPLERYMSSTSSSGERWVYTRPVAMSAKAFTLCVVAFDAREDRVSLTKRTTTRITGDMQVPATPLTSSRPMPRLRLIASDLSQRELDSSEGMTYIIVGVRGGSTATYEQIESMLTRVHQALEAMNMKNTEVVEVLPIRYQKSTPPPPYRFTNTHPIIEGTAPTLIVSLTQHPDAYYAYLYANGILYSLPPGEAGPFADATIEDLKWTIGHIAIGSR